MSSNTSVSNEKAESVKQIQALFQKYSIFAIADLKGLKASQLQVLKKKFKDDLEIRVAKNTLVKIAIKNLASKYKDVDEITKYLSGPNAFVFSKKNPFFMYLMFEKNKVASAAAPGDLAPNDITVTAGNTGMQPGPILSKFGAAKIPTKIQDGNVWIAEDTVAVEKGQAVSADVADLLSKLGLKPIMVGLKLRMGYDGGVIPYDILSINLDDYKVNVATAAASAVNLSVNAVYPTKETAPLIISKAFVEAKGVAIDAGVPLPELIGEMLAMADVKGKAVAQAVSAKNPELKF
ncbi:MAG TPA: 50S ribosomal protein L10 [Candidatus Methanomethylicus sp.]|jgi:large subunit ribosomal protein L10|nr:50S ribosomal protein L10 [Candidatus Methanomethylicus sp.]HRR54240.1 50S ribosomal protein L10 [Candidatus Methanomethylicus sp.]